MLERSSIPLRHRLQILAIKRQSIIWSIDVLLKRKFGVVLNPLVGPDLAQAQDTAQTKWFDVMPINFDLAVTNKVQESKYPGTASERFDANTREQSP